MSDAAALPPLRPLAAWAGRLSRGSDFGAWKGGEPDDSGVRSWPWVAHGPDLTAFMKDADRHG